MFNIFISNDKKIDKARLALIESLNKGDIENLLNQMGNTNIFSDLLIKKRQAQTSNTDEISWYAYRRAEDLSLSSDKEQLIKRLNNESNDSKRRHIYFCLAHYCKNTNDKSLFNFLMDCLESEKNNDCKLSILIGILYMPKSKDLNIEPIKKLTKTRNRDLKINSIIALQQTNDEQVENLLLSLFIETKDNHTKSIIINTLETTGTEKSIPYLKESYKKTRDYGLRGDIERTIEKITAKT